MKKTKSFSLEEDIISKIKEYQKMNKLSSESAALERIILSFTNNNDIKGLLEEIVCETKKENKVNEIKENIEDAKEEKEVEEEPENSNLLEGIQSSFAKMED